LFVPRTVHCLFNVVKNYCQLHNPAATTLWKQILQHPDPCCTCRQNGTSNVHTSSAVLLNDLLQAGEGNQLSYINFENLD